MHQESISRLQSSCRIYKFTTPEERKNWKPFGLARNGENVTKRSVDDIPFERVGNFPQSNEVNHSDQYHHSTNELIRKFQEKRRAREMATVNNITHTIFDKSENVPRKALAQNSVNTNKFIPSAISKRNSNQILTEGMSSSGSISRRNENSVKVKFDALSSRARHTRSFRPFRPIISSTCPL